jgi:hypothetical protein
MRYNLGCLYSAHLKDVRLAIEVLGPFYENIRSLSHLSHSEVDPDLQLCRSDPTFQKMVAAAKNRLETVSDPIAAQ